MARIRLHSSNADRQRVYRRRVKARQKLRGSTTSVETDPLRELALARFHAEPTKCYQRHIREVMAEHDQRPALKDEDYRRADVSQISSRLAASIILRYEWLASMPSDPRLCYGLWPTDRFHSSDDLLGAVCFAKGANKAALASVAPYEDTMILARGACSMRAGRNGASFLISRACRMAARDHGVTHFVAYSDPAAGEKGTIYRALGWQCLGVSEQGAKVCFVSPEGERIGAYEFNRRSDDRFFALGWNGRMPKYRFLRSIGWREIEQSRKLRWLFRVKV